ncbi:hypothetical protein BP6252_05915 [Coleophoma cylindrospora]|uniref:Uncharacterized protein n=1 Tax=Coleophoma cylindrospora TaxID=1849047 RepID=A0A3D8RL61_9HELO|nr:hypothetical protein BP6252_05915 [Coleophoma cylindrospora]
MMDWSIWNHLVLQLSHHEPFIHDSIVAIGALSKALEIDEALSKADTNAQALSKMAKLHKEFAHLKYGKAVQTINSSLARLELRQVLVACLLIYCFEVLLNNRHLALSHVVSGHRMLQEWLIRYDQKASGNRTLHSPNPTTVDDELIDVFHRMDLQISTMYDSRPIELHRATIRQGLRTVQQMPLRFNDLIEARGYLLVIMRRSYHFLATTWSSSQASCLVRAFEMVPPNNVIVTAGSNIYATSYKVSNKIRAEQKEFYEDISQWLQAFQPLYQKTQQPEIYGFRNHVIGALIRIHAISTAIVIAGVLFTKETSYDSFLSEFQDIFSLATIVVDAYRKKSSQTMPSEAGYFLDLGITSPLYLLVARCRDHSLRANAIELLRGWHVEACWQPSLIASIGDFLMEVEEYGNTDVVIPDKMRAVITAVCDEPQQNGKREALIQCVQRYGGPNGEPVWHERKVRY